MTSLSTLFAQGKRIMDREALPAEGRYCLVSPQIYKAMCAEMDGMRVTHHFATAYGAIRRFMGFELIRDVSAPWGCIVLTQHGANITVTLELDADARAPGPT